MKKTIAIIFASTLCLAPVAFANANTNSTNVKAWNVHTGTYVEANAGANLVYLGVFSSDGSTSNGGLYGEGYSLALGYKVTPHFGFEAGFMQNYVDFNKYVDDADKGAELRQHSNIGYGTLVFSMPLGNRASLIGKAGLMYASAENHGIVLPYTGVGLGYAVTRNLEVTAQYQGAIYGIAGAGLLSGGVIYHF